MKKDSNNNTLFPIDLNKVQKAGWVSSISPPVLHSLFSTLDLVVLDFEHYNLTVDELNHVYYLSQFYKKPYFVRTKGIDDISTSRYLDLGAQGIVCPMVNDQETAEALVRQCKFPPVGDRGCGLYLANQFGGSFESYYNEFNSKSQIFVQIEHKNAIPNLKGILTTKGIDGFFIGPYDMSSSLGVAGELNHKKVLEAESISLKIAKEEGLCPGIHLVRPTKELIQEKIEMGFKFIVLGTDFIMIEETAKQYQSWFN